MKKTEFRATVRGAVIGALAIALFGGVAWASIPDSTGVIHACYGKNGALHLLDTERDAGCGRSETPIDWNQTGPQGEAGLAGPTGPQGPKGDAGNLALAGQSCPAGEAVTGFDPAGRIVCGSAATPDPDGNPDGSPDPAICDDGDPSTIDSYDSSTQTCRNVPS